MNTQYRKCARAKQGSWIMLLLALLMCVCRLHAQNSLSIPAFSGQADKTVYAPVFLDNADEVVSVQFDAVLPFDMPVDEMTKITTRANDHSVSVYNRGNHLYRVVLMSMQNLPLRGNSGLLLQIPMTVQDDLTTDNVNYEMVLRNIVITDGTGQNIASESSLSSIFTIDRGELPDLAVSEVESTVQNASPGDQLTIAYVIENIGTGPTLAGWTEKFYLESVLTGNRIFLGSQPHNATLDTGNSYHGQATMQLVQLPHADGPQVVVLEVVPAEGCGELLSAQGNNEGRSMGVVNLAKILSFYYDKTTLHENYYYDYITLRLQRSGDWTLPEVLQVTCDVDGLLMLDDTKLYSNSAKTVRIPANQANLTMRLRSVNDQIRRSLKATITIAPQYANSGYETKTLTVTRTDDDEDPLTLTTSVTSITEGQMLTLTATRGGEMADDAEITINSNQASRFTGAPWVIKLVKGQSKGSITIASIDDDIPQLDCTATFTARATGYQTSKAHVSLIDNDRPHITLSLSPSVVCENAGLEASTLTISRDRGESQPITLWLSTNSTANVVFGSQQVTIPKGEKSCKVSVGVTDNNNVDGTQSYRLNAALYVAADGQVVTQGDCAYASTTFTVTDDESPYITLTPTSSTRSEGSQARLTLTRHVASTSQPQTVLLSCSDPDDVNMPTSVTINAGSSQTSFNVDIKRNATEDDDRSITIEAQAEGLNNTQAIINITDRTLPDAISTDVAVTSSPVYAGMEATLAATIGNIGTAILPAGMQIDFYLANNSSIGRYTSSYHICSVATTEPIDADSEKTFSYIAVMQQLTGTYYLYAKLNANNAVSEFNTTNNVTQRLQRVNIESPYSLKELATDKDSYLPSEEVRVTGRVVSLQHGGLHQQRVSISLNGNGQDGTPQTVAIDEVDGTFEAYLRISGSATGMLTVNARAVGQTDASLQKQVNVYALSLTISESTSRTITGNGTITGKLRLRNNSGKPVSGIVIAQPTTLPAGCQLTLNYGSQTLPGQISGTLGAGASLYIDFSLNILDETMSGNHIVGFTAQTAEGVNASRQLEFTHYKDKTEIVLEQEGNPNLTGNGINTTLLVGSTRDLWVKVVNKGGLESGDIEISTRGGEWLQNLTASPLPSIKGNSTSWIHLQLTHLSGMHPGQTFTGELTAMPKNGNGCKMPIKVTITGTEWSKLDVAVSDVYSLSDQDFSHVEGAAVTVSDAATGKQVLAGTIGSDGHWQTNQIAQGTYIVSVKAQRHKTASQTLVIGPDEERAMQLYLPYQAVITEFVTNQSLEDGSYTMTSNIDVDAQAPQAIVLAYLPEEGFNCGHEESYIMLLNVGKRDAKDVRLILPQVNGVSFSIENDGPINLEKGMPTLVHVIYEGGDESLRRRIIASSLMHYSFEIDGNTYSEDDNYQSLVGCFTPGRPEPTPIVDDTKPSSDEDADNTHYHGSENKKEKDGQGNKGALPSYNSYFYLEFDDIEGVLTTGEPFTATLTVANGQEGNFHYVNFYPMVSDDGDDAFADYADRFLVEQGEMTGFIQQADGNLVLPGNTTGTIRLVFTPLPEAATDGNHTYYIGGALTYTNAADDISNTAKLPQKEITIGGLAEITVTPIIQRIFPGQGSTAQMAWLIENKGTMEVIDFSLNNQQPLVRSLADYMPICYKTEAQSLPETATGDFSNLNINSLESGQALTARWLYASNQGGRVDNFDRIGQSIQMRAGVNIHTTIGNVRELYRTVRNMTTDEAMNDEEGLSEAEILVNADVMLIVENEREQTVPDRVLYSDGSDGGAIANVSGKTTVTGAGSDYTITVEADAAGWVYGRLHDPTNGAMLLQKVIRQSDGKVISMANFWQTDSTLQSNLTYIKENLLHFADKIPSQRETYSMHYVQREGTNVELLDVQLFTADGKEVKNGDVINGQVTKVVIGFTGSMKKVPNNSLELSTRDVTFNSDVLGNPVVSPGNDVYTFNLDMNKIGEIPGKHILTVNPKMMRYDRRDYLTQESFTIEWTEQLNGTAHIDIAVAPISSYGSVDKESGDYSYGVLSLTATAAEGHQFDYWLIDGQKLSDSQSQMDYEVWKDASIQAYFSIRQCQITVEVNDEEMGELSRGTLGSVSYEWGTEVTLSARAKKGYEFSHWLLNGVKQEGAQWSMTIQVTDDATYTAVFREKTLTGALLTALNGWIYQINADITTVTLINAHEVSPLPTGDVVIPSIVILNDHEYQVTGIGGDANDATAAGAFDGCAEMTNLTLEGKQAMTIEKRAIEGCDALTAINVDYVTMHGYKTDIQIDDDVNQLLTPFVEPAKELTTFACDANIDFTATQGLQAYVATHYNAEQGSVKLSPVNMAPAGEGIVLRSEPGIRYRLQRIAEVGEPPVNMLVGAVEAVYLTTTQDGMTNFVLSNGRFGKSDNGRLAAGKAYLTVPTSELTDNAGEVRSINLDFGEETTSVRNLIDQDNVGYWYTLDGRRLSKRPAKKGVYLQYGKKKTVK